MPETFFICFETSPEPGSVIDSRIEDALAYCWVAESDPGSAMMKANYKVRQSGWKIEKVETPPVQVTRESFDGKDWGLECYEKCQEDGIALFFFGRTNVEELQTDEPTLGPMVSDINLHEWLSDQRHIKNAGGCLFYDSTDECLEVIDAHSIQRSKALSAIAEDGYIYSPSLSFGDIKKAKGKASLARSHINSFSTFRGLCKTHDNLIFQPIDDDLLKPTDQQAFLYAYRSILKQLSAKNFAVESLRNQLSRFTGSSATREFLETSLEGNSWGQRNLEREKACYDQSHREQKFSDIRYVVFNSKARPTVVFSGGLFPDWGFNGEPIQNLADFEKNLSVMTFSFGPTKDGWAFLFAWHKSSDEVGRYFISTLQRSIRDDGNLGNLLFQLVVKGCENTAFSPTWIESLSKDQRTDLAEALTFGSDLLRSPDGNYLTNGFDAPPGWEFSSVEDNLNVKTKRSLRRWLHRIIERWKRK